MRHHLSSRRGFTLIEMSIVIIIIGLLVGGIMAGQSLIRSAELGAIASENSRYTTAIGTFKDKYFSLPGDFSTASSNWSTAGNGNGDGMIKNTIYAGDDTNAANRANEISAFWMHLSLAGIIEGSFTAKAAAAAPSNTALTIGTHVPPSKLTGAGWNIAYLGVLGVDGVPVPTNGAQTPNAATFFASDYNHVLLLGSGTDALAPGAVLTTEEAWNLDTKLDDSKPDTGNVMTLESQGSTTGTGRCTDRNGSTSALAGASDYVLSNTTKNCSLVFKTLY